MKTLINGEALEELKKLPDKSIDMCMTSPPYWGLRDYGTSKWEGGSKNCDHFNRKLSSYQSTLHKNPEKKKMDSGMPYKDICGKCRAVRIDRQIGLESTIEEFVNNLCNIFDEINRVLKDSGSCWINLGDTYSTNNSVGSRWNTGKNLPISGSSRKLKEMSEIKTYKKCKAKIKTKSLCMIPERFAIEMINRGWILRNKIIWHKPNCMPSSIKDRFTVDFEYLFFFSKNKKYYFETQYEPAKYDGRKDTIMKGTKKYAIPTGWDKSKGSHNKLVGRYAGEQQNRNHERWTKNTAGEYVRIKRTVWKISPKGFKEAHFAVYPEKLCETPINAACPEGGTVIDPFAGSGTTGVVAEKQGKNSILIELNLDYCKLIEKRFNDIGEF